MNSYNTYYSILNRRWEYVWEYVPGSFMIEKEITFTYFREEKRLHPISVNSKNLRTCDKFF